MPTRFTSLLPNYIVFDFDLSANELRLYALIESMRSNTRDAFFSNAYIAKFFGVSVRNVQRMTRKLKDKGYIERHFFDGKWRWTTLMKGD